MPLPFSRWRGFVALLPLCACIELGCIELDGFPCIADEQCVLDGAVGICSADGYCAFADEDCASGYAYSRGAPAAWLGDCTEPEAVEAGCAVQLAAGREHTCALRSDGAVLCWGRNDLGQLGRGMTGPAAGQPAPVVLPEDIGSVTSISAGTNQTCALGETGRAYCWGRNDSGQVVPAALTASEPTPREVSWLPAVEVLTTMHEHTCARARDGGVTCWGASKTGQLGVTTTGAGPLAVPDPTGALSATEAIAGGYGHSCALSNGAVLCWGGDGFGQRGDGSGTSGVGPSDVLLPSAVSTIFSGRHHTCALATEPEALWCWGRNDFGQLGDGTNSNRVAPVLVADPPAGIVAMAAKFDSTCALDGDGALWCWGSNEGNIFGDASASVSRPVLVPITDELPDTVRDMALGLAHLCVITSSANVWCWGNGERSQLGPLDPTEGTRAVEVDLACPSV